MVNACDYYYHCRWLSVHLPRSVTFPRVILTRMNEESRWNTPFEFPLRYRCFNSSNRFQYTVNNQDSNSKLRRKMVRWMRLRSISTAKKYCWLCSFSFLIKFSTTYNIRIQFRGLFQRVPFLEIVSNFLLLKNENIDTGWILVKSRFFFFR